MKDCNPALNVVVRKSQSKQMCLRGLTRLTSSDMCFSHCPQHKGQTIV